MSWKQVSIDDVGNKVHAKKKHVENFLCLLHKILHAFNDLRAEAIKFEQLLDRIRLTVENEGPTDTNTPQIATVNFYNASLYHFLNAINAFIKLKTGIHTTLIRKWSALDQYTTYSIDLKRLKNYDTCNVDNMLVGDIDLYPEILKTVIVNIGVNTVPFDLLNQDITYNAFKIYITDTTPNNIHLLITYFNKNIEVIEKSIKHVDHLIKFID